jgi:hypothetical protein
MVWFLSVMVAELTFPCSMSETTFEVSCCWYAVPRLAYVNTMKKSSSITRTARNGPRK